MSPLELRDVCRGNLIKYLHQALDLLPRIGAPAILDLGCGTGVPTLAIAERFAGEIHAVDTDPESIEYLIKKISGRRLSNRVFCHTSSVFDLELPVSCFDIVLAEGLLNVIGFEEGLQVADRYLKTGGSYIIHDELPNRQAKLDLFKKYSYKLIGSFEISIKAWQKEYFDCLEKHLSAIKSPGKPELFKKELEEAEFANQHPSLLGSIYYILRKE